MNHIQFTEAPVSGRSIGAPKKASNERFKIPRGTASVYLDALRGLAAFGVLIHHWQDIFSFGDASQFSRLSFRYWLHALIGLGHQWVVVFFVMSGYLVGGTVLRSVADHRWSLSRYILARGTRLYIVLIPALILGGLVDLCGIHYLHAAPLYLGQTDIASVHFDVASRLHLSTGIENGLFLQTIRIPFTHSPILTFGSNGPLWSLAYEFWFYVGFPLLVFALRPAGSYLTRLSCLGLLILWIIFTGPAISVLWLIWLMGVAIHFAPPMSKAQNRLGFPIACVVLVAAVFCLKAAHPLGEMVGKIYWTDFVFGAAVTAFLYALIHWKGHPVPKHAASFAQHTAASSYTLYLVHLPALIFLRGLLQPPGAWTTNAFDFKSALFAMLIVIVYAQLVYYLFERQTAQVRRWLESRIWGIRKTPTKGISQGGP